ncbi:MAG: 23S rRNA (uracil(1939)-C(5))-methyltransferase RlmD [Gammaproteobacteria bacterium]|nr:MAG: 23S rRNA (uracil(1939)-C(5))-methyltransferase RlmD [Gammaproteobacteria bacterium]
MARRRRRRTLPAEPFNAEIESLSHDGKGVAHLDGKVHFIDGALPGEKVSFIYTDRRRDFAEGRLEELFSRSPIRIEPGCQHFGICGGCSWQHISDANQIIEKQKLLQEQFKHIGKIESFELWPPLTGPVWGYRHKARLGVKNVDKKGRVLVGFREKRSAFVADIKRCPVLHPSVGEKLELLSELIGTLSVRSKLPQIEVAVGEDKVILVFRILEDVTPDDLLKMSKFAEQEGFVICLQRGGPDTVVTLDGQPVPELGYTLPDEDVKFSFLPTDFTQVNPEINRKMIRRVIETLDPTPEDRILDLFCGLGNFTLPLAKKAGEVVGVEGSEVLVKRAAENARKNGLDNVHFYTADLFKELKGQPWAKEKFTKVLLDPSRAGAKEVIERLPALGIKTVCYVSCNPSTLARDTNILVHELGYKLVKAGVMDMFPHTAHVESIALFEKR